MKDFLKLKIIIMVALLLSVPGVKAQGDTFLADPKTFLDSLNGKYEVGLFSGSLNYSYPVRVPKGRNQMMPQLNLLYSNLDHRYGSELGYGWSLPINGIYRTPVKGTDTIYNSDHFTADIFGSSEELIVVDEQNGLYAPKNEGSFHEYTFDGVKWLVKDKKGITYTFGASPATRQDDPQDPSRVFKWMLEKMEDTTGNFVTFSYLKSNGAIYPDVIRYTGFESDPGIFEIKFNYQNRGPITSYRSNFKVVYDKLVTSIDLISYASGSPEIMMTYDLDYTQINNAVNLLTTITAKAGGQELPPTVFDYFDGTENVEIKKINSLYKITEPLGGLHEFVYKPASAYRGGGGETTNWLPFVVYTVYQEKSQSAPGEPVYTTTYDYQNGHYFYDDLDAYKREYAGFGHVTVTDSLNQKHHYYFHQSQNDPNNPSNEALGEYEDHISKKGRVYRDEQYDNQGNLLKAVISKWESDTLADADPERDRFVVSLTKSVAVDYGENGDSKSKAVSHDYDDYGNVTETVDYGEVTMIGENGDFSDTGEDKVITHTEYVYDVANHLLSYPKQVEKKDENNVLVSRQKFYYDGLNHGQITKGNLTKRDDYTDDNNFVSTLWQVNDRGMITQTTNPRGYATDISYDVFNLYPTTVTNAKQQPTQYVYDPFFGVAIEETDPNGLTRQTELDDFGRVSLQKLKKDNGQMASVRQISYDLNNTPAFITETLIPGGPDTSGNPIEITKKTWLDGFQRPIQIKTEAEGSDYNTVSLTYDEKGRIKAEYLPQFSQNLTYQAPGGADPKTVYTYDALGRVKTISNSQGTTSNQYEAWQTNVTDADGKQKGYGYDARNNLVEVKERLNGIFHSTHYRYNANNYLIKVTDADDNEQEITYDFLGRKLAEELLHTAGENNPRTYSFTYDDNGNVTGKTDAKFQTLSMTYDELDRMIAENGGEVTYGYDSGPNAIGRLSSVNFGSGSKAYEYDLRGNVIKESKTINGTTYQTNFTHDLLGNIQTITYPDAQHTVISYGYNNAGQIEKIPGYVGSMDYSPIGSPSLIGFYNGVVTINTYDPAKLYRLTHKVTNAGGGKVQDISYTFDPVGNITHITDVSDTVSGKTAVYTYDDLHRLTGAVITGTGNGEDYAEQYSYGITGNMLSKTGEGSYSYNDVHPQAVTGIGAVTYSYDENGSLLGDGVWNHSYDSRNRLVSSDDGTTFISYTYDEGQTRVSKSEGGTVTVYVNDYYEKEGTKERLFVMANGLKVAGVSDGEKVFYHEDHLSGSSVSTDDNGGVLELNDYYPYGSQRIEERAVGYENDYLFTGQERDEETGLYYYGARYYDPGMGRFTSIDPWKGELSDPQSLNKYSYVRNNPLRYVDPSGEEFISAILGAVATLLFSPETAYAPDDEMANGISLGTVKSEKPNVVKTAFAVAAGEKTTVSIVDFAFKTVKQLQRYNQLVNEGVEAKNAAHRAKNFVGDYELTEHAVDQMKRRGVGLNDVEKILENNKSFNYNYNGELRKGFWDKDSQIFISTTAENKIPTVIKGSRVEKYVEGIKSKITELKKFNNK